MNEKKIDLIFFLSDFLEFNCEINSEKIIQIFEKNDFPNLLKQIIIFFEKNCSLKYFLEIINFFENNFTNIFYTSLRKHYFNYEYNIRQILEIEKIPDELKNILEKILEIFERFFLFLKEKNFFLQTKKIENNTNEVIQLSEENFEKFIEDCFIFIDEFLLSMEEKKCNFEINQKYKNYFTNDYKNLIINNFYFSPKIDTENQKKIIFFLLEEIENHSIDFAKKNIFIIENENDLKILEEIFKKKISQEEVKNQLTNNNCYLLVNKNLNHNFHFHDYSLDCSNDSAQNNSLDSYDEETNIDNTNIKKNDLKNFNNEDFLLKIYKDLIRENKIEIKKISIHGLKKFFNNEEKFLKEEILNIKIKKNLDDKFILSNHFHFLVDEIIQNFLCEKKENQTKIVLEEIIKNTIVPKFHKNYFQFILTKITPFFENFFDFHSEILREFSEIIFCKNVEIEMQNIKIDGFCFYVIFEKSKIILIDVYYKNISKREFENFSNPRMIPVIFFYKKKYPEFEIEIKVFSEEKTFEINEGIVDNFEQIFLEKFDTLYENE